MTNYVIAHDLGATCNKATLYDREDTADPRARTGNLQSDS